MIRNHITKPVIIIGMHRSGTTFLADALNEAQIFMGVMREHNGEALHFLSLNQQLLAAQNADWLSPKPISETKIQIPTANQIFAEHIKCRYSTDIRLRLFHNMDWGFKDPRTTFTLGFWLKIFPEARVIHLVRNGAAVAKSLNTRNFKPGEVWDERLNNLDFCFELWEKYVAEAVKYKSILGEEYLQLRYEDLISGHETSIGKLEKFVGKKVTLRIKPTARAHAEFSPELQKIASQSTLMQQFGYTV